VIVLVVSSRGSDIPNLAVPTDPTPKLSSSDSSAHHHGRPCENRHPEAFYEDLATLTP